MNNQIWQKYIQYLKELSPKVYIPKSVRTLTDEALKAAPDDERLLAISEILKIISRPEPQASSQKFKF